MEGQINRLIFWERSILIPSLVVLFFVTVTIACAPRAVPLTPPEKPSPVSGTTRNAATVTLTPEEIAWEKLVQAAKQEGKVTIYGYSMIGDVGLAVAQGFKDKYGITAEMISGSGAQLAQRILTEQRISQVAADVVEGNPSIIYPLKEANFTVSSADIPVLREKDVWLIDPKVADDPGHILGHALQTYHTYINTQLVKAGSEPRSLRELTQPKWAGKMVTEDPTFSSSSYTFFYTLVRRKFTDMATLRAIGMNDLHFEVNTNQMAADMVKGKNAVHVGAADNSYAKVALPGVPVKAIALEEGSVVASSAIAAIKNSPHPNAAKLFVNWIITQEGQTKYIKERGILSIRKDVPDFRPEASQAAPIRLVALTAEDYKENAKAFSERVLLKLWKE